MEILKNSENFKGCDFVVKLDKSRKNTKIKILQIFFIKFFENDAAPTTNLQELCNLGFVIMEKMRSTFAFALVERTFNKKYFLLNSLKGGGEKLSFKKVFPAKNINIINSSPRLLKKGKALYF